MKKNMIKVAFVAAIAVVCGINVFNAQKSKVLSEVVLANVEALASYELNTDLCISYKNRECVQLITTPAGSSHQTWYDQINKSF